MGKLKDKNQNSKLKGKNPVSPFGHKGGIKRGFSFVTGADG